MTDSVERLGRAMSGERLARTYERTYEAVTNPPRTSFSFVTPAGGINISADSGAAS